jgi:hypothetical protein
LSRAVHLVQDHAPCAIRRFEASDNPALQAFAQRRDAHAEDAGSGGQVDAVHLVVQHCPASVLRPDEAGSLSQAPEHSSIFYQSPEIVAERT